MKNNVFKICALLLAIGQGAWAENVTFNVCSWDGTKVVTTVETHDATVIDTSNSDDWYALGDGYYVAKGEINWKVFNVTGSVAHLILADGANVTTKHVKLESGHTLHIHTQAGGSGTLSANNDDGSYNRAAGIGGGEKANAGDLYIHGGTITATGYHYGAGIGGGYQGLGGNVHIYGGTVTARSGGGAAGIGGGFDNSIASNCSVNIYGGTVEAYGRGIRPAYAYYGAGIGSGSGHAQGGDINIFGGNVIANANGKYAAGIGPGDKGSGGVVNISGGVVQAYAEENAAGIGGKGGKINITGGTIYAGAPSLTLATISAMAGEVIISDGMNVTQATNQAAAMTGTPVSYAERIAKCTETPSGSSFCVKVEPCRYHNIEGFFCTYCNYYKNESIAGTWTDENLRADAFESVDETQKVITITSESQLGLLAYQISSSEGYKGYTILLENDLDMSDHKWNLASGTFQGTFDGQGHTISGIINSTDHTGDAALFPHNSGTVKRVKLVNSYIVGNRYVGAIAGDNTGTVEDCYAGSDVFVVANNGNDSKACGGVVGFQINSPFDNTTAQTVGCYSAANVNGTSNVGGIVGLLGGTTEQKGGTISYCVSKATVKSSGDNIGIVAGLVNDATCSNNYYIAAEASSNADAKRAYGVTLSDALNKESYKILAAADATKSYETSGIKTYSSQIAVGDDWYVCESGTFSFKLPAKNTSNEDVAWSYVTVNNGDVLQPTSETYSFTSDNATTKYVIDGAAWAGKGTETNPYLIKTTANWNAINSVFGRVNETELFKNVYFKQTADIEITEIIGITSQVHADKAFCGNYDGDKHSLKCMLANTDGTNSAAAPFFKVNGATIKNLRVEGSISGGIHSAGLVAFITGETATKIDYCRVSAIVNSDNAYAGGFIGHLNESKIEISNSLFDGRLSGTTGAYFGAFIGWSEPTATPSLTNCVENGNYDAADSHLAFGWKNNGSEPLIIKEIKDSYNVSTFDVIAGATQIFPLTSGMTTAPFVLTVTPEAADPTKAFPLGGYVVSVNGNFYLGDREDAAFYTQLNHDAYFTISYAEPYLVKNVKVSDEAATLVNAETKQYRFVQHSAASVVTGTFDPPLDGSGSEQDPWVITCEQDFYNMKSFREAQIPMSYKFFKVIKKADNTPYTLSEEDVQVDGRLVISGDIELNTGTGKTLLILQGIELSKDNKLTLGGDGTLKINYTGLERAGIGAKEVGTLVINSGTINVEGGSYSAALGGSYENVSGGTIIINGGEIYAVGGPNAAAIGGGANHSGKSTGVCGDITINGGKVTAKTGTVKVPSAIGSGQNASPSGTLTLGWTNLDDYLETGSESGTPEAVAQSLSSVTFTKPFLVDGTKTIATADDILMKKLVPAIDLKNGAANSTSLNSFDGKTANVVFSDRTLYKDGAWNTVCLPFSVESFTGTPLEGATVKTLESSSYANKTLTINFSQNVNSIEAGKPYIIKWDKPADYDANKAKYDIANPVFTGVTLGSTANTVQSDKVDFLSIYDPAILKSDDKTVLYMGSANKLYHPVAEVTINAFRAYFKLKGITIGDISSANTGSRIVLNFGEEEVATSIHNSQLTIDNEDGAWYSVAGSRLSSKPTQKGVYIYKGRKVVVK